MYNILIAVGAGLAAFGLFFAIFSNALGAILPAAVVLLGTYFVLARRSLKQLEAIMMAAQKDIMAKRIDPALATMQQGFALSKWQLFIEGQVHAQIGMLLYMLKRFDEAQPHLEKSFVRIGQARAMLGALQYTKKDYAAMERTFEEAVRHSKKDGFLWSIYGWCLSNAGMQDKAVGALARGLAESPSDEKLKANHLALQNGERLRMKGYGQEWWAFHLESPPKDVLMAMNPQLGAGKKGYRTYKPPTR